MAVTIVRPNTFVGTTATNRYQVPALNNANITNLSYYNSSALPVTLQLYLVPPSQTVAPIYILEKIVIAAGETYLPSSAIGLQIPAGSSVWDSCVENNTSLQVAMTVSEAT